MTQKPSDFVQVQLSAAGIAFAAGGPVRVSNAHFSYEFSPGVPVRVLTSEWSRMLANETVGGKSILEIAAGPAAPPAEPEEKGN
jgi:hypothetical protein